MKIHELKLQLPFSDDVLSGRKNFEIRQNDRGYQCGDRVVFRTYDGMIRCHHSVDDEVFEITYVMSGWGLKEDYVVFGIKRIGND